MPSPKCKASKKNMCLPVFRTTRECSQLIPHLASEEAGAATTVATPFKVLAPFKLVLVAVAVVRPSRFPLNEDGDEDEDERNAAAVAFAAASAAIAEGFAISTSVSSDDAGFAVA